VGGDRSPWSYVFSSDGGINERGWKHVRDGETIAFEPIGTLEFRTGLRNGTCRAGDFLDARPRLYTDGGLLINTCFRGFPASPGLSDGPVADIALRNEDGRALAITHSGFA
jgi:hypothetical protein